MSGERRLAGKKLDPVPNWAQGGAGHIRSVCQLKEMSVNDAKTVDQEALPEEGAMTISKFNHEGYYDPTAYEALANIEVTVRKARFRPIIYVCSPYAGDIDTNTANARRYCRFVVDSGCIPIAPHLLFPLFMREDGERDLALFMDIVLLTKCAELWVFGDAITRGMGIEIARAMRKGQRVRYFTKACEEVTGWVKF